MAVIVQTVNSIGAGLRVLLAGASNTYTEIQGVAVVSTDGSDAIFSNSTANLKFQLSGQVIGGNGVELGGSGTFFSLFNSAGALLEGNTGFGMLTTGAISGTVVNYGEIAGQTAGLKLAQGTVINYGTISDTGDNNGRGITISTGFADVRNYGTISGTSGYAIFVESAAGSGGYVANYGTINGSVYEQSTSSSFSIYDTFINTGVINGWLQISGTNKYLTATNSGVISGTANLLNSGSVSFNSTFGSVGQEIFLNNAASSYVVGGTTGGRITGGAGNDVLIANPTQSAADNAAQAALIAGGGTNALYGGGAYTTFMAGSAVYNQIWGGASKMEGVAGYANNTLSFNQAANRGVYVDLLNGHNAYLAAPNSNWTGSGTFEDSIVHVPNVVGSSYGDLIQADSGVDRITGGFSADQLYAGSGAGSQDTFIYTSYGDSTVVAGYDTIVGFKLGSDKIDLSALDTDASHLAISTSGTSNTVYVEQTAGTFNANTDLAMIVNTSAAGGLHGSDFVF